MTSKIISLLSQLFDELDGTETSGESVYEMGRKLNVNDLRSVLEAFSDILDDAVTFAYAREFQLTPARASDVRSHFVEMALVAQSRQVSYPGWRALIENYRIEGTWPFADLSKEAIDALCTRCGNVCWPPEEQKPHTDRGLN